tara:strand:+ start:2613 stop:3302 length:690 start_codon:yes stop_codon:yes gene_type:complete
MKMYKYLKIFFLMIILVFNASCKGSENDQINVYLAASLLDQVKNSIESYNKKINIDSSGSYDLVNKILLGAKPDLVLIANYKLNNEFIENYELIENYYSNKVILVHNQNYKMDLNEICEKNYEIGIADPSRAPLGKLSSEILKSNTCHQKEYNTRIASNASSLINKINLKYLNHALIYENDFTKINKKLDFKVSSDDFQKNLDYSFFVSKKISLGNKRNILDFIKFLKN